MSCERNVFCEIVVNDYTYTSQEYVLSVSRGVTEPAFFTFIWMIPHTHRRRSKLANYILTLFLCMSRHKQIAFPGSTVRRCILILANVAGLIANFGKMLYLLQCLICQRWHMKKQNKTNSAWLLLTLLEWELFKLVIMPHVIVAHWTRLPAHLCSSALRFIVTHAFVV